jgi:tryptophan synthase alpha chain
MRRSIVVNPNNRISLMTHMIAGYPDGEADLAVAQGLIDGGSSYLEVQFPFSDPSADGVPIQTACMNALDGGFRVDAGFELIKRIKAISEIPVFIMSYGGLVFARGVEKFVDDTAACGAEGLIIPDLMPGYDEGLYEAGKRRGIKIVPVIPPVLDQDRLNNILAQSPAYLYASLRVGITGSRTEIDDAVLSFLARLRSTGIPVFAGFGIQTRAQVVSLANHADTLIVGSAIVRMIAAAVNEEKPVYAAVRNKVRGLLEDESTVEKKETE